MTGKAAVLEYSLKRMKLTGLLGGVAGFLFLAFSAAAADYVSPETEMIRLQNGFDLVLSQPMSVPVLSNGTSVFVVQDSQRYAGIWGWMGGRFFVLRSMEDPGANIPLDANQPSCQIHIDQAANPLVGSLHFRAMTYQGQMSDGQSSMYAVQSVDKAGNIFMSCLTDRGTSGARVALTAGDLVRVFGRALAGVKAN
jgi:hypothetical protein